MKHLIITETEAQKEIITKILAKETLEKTNLLVGGGFEPSLSLARSFRLKRDENVVLIHDASTSDHKVLEERLVEANDFVQMIHSEGEFTIIPFSPNLETVIKNQIPEQTKSLANLFKKKAVEPGSVALQFGNNADREAKKITQMTLSPATLKKIRSTKSIKQIATFIN